MKDSKADTGFFRQYTAYLFENRVRIWADAELSAAYSPEMRLTLAYITGGGLLPLGLLLDLWARDEWTTSCEGCQGKVLIHRMGGSPLSGANRFSGVCLGCSEVIESSIRPFVQSSLEPVIELRQKWNVDEDFAFEQVASRDPSIQRLDIQGGMTMETDDGPVEMQIGFSSWEEFAEGGGESHRLLPSIPIEEVIPRLLGGFYS